MAENNSNSIEITGERVCVCIKNDKQQKLIDTDNDLAKQKSTFTNTDLNDQLEAVIDSNAGVFRGGKNSGSRQFSEKFN